MDMGNSRVLSIQLPMSRAACLKSRWPVNPQFKDLSGRILLRRTTTCSDRSSGSGSSARYGKRVPVPRPMRSRPTHTVRDIERVCRFRKRERRPCPDAAPPGVS
jgi:hypothetical protein